ncbi:hypothetical protein ACNS7O_00870 [Haloferacaceae archaeon DSL9]
MQSPLQTLRDRFRLHDALLFAIVTLAAVSIVNRFLASDSTLRTITEALSMLSWIAIGLVVVVFFYRRLG